MTDVRRVGCNLLWLVPDVVGGSEEYTVGLLEAWAAAGSGHRDLELVLFVNRRFVQRHRALTQLLPTVVAPIDGGSKPIRVATEASWLWRAARRHRVELLHHTGGTMPLVRGTAGMVTLHDLQPWAMPEHFSLVKRGYLHAVVPRSLREARAVVTLSEWARHDVAERIGVPLERIVCVPPGLRSHLTDELDVGTVLDAYDLRDRPFFVYPAITYPHKNHAVLVRAFAHVAAEHPDAVLVLTAGEGPAESEVRALLHQLGVAHRVRRTGRIPASHLDVLYRTATALTFPSRYEGFGLPVLEAMSRGCPVLAGAATALPEVVADGGLLLEPSDVGAWAAAMHRLLVDDAHRRELAARAHDRAATFSWDQGVERLASTYRSVLDRVPSQGGA